MDFTVRDLVTIVGGAVSLTGLYYALKRDVIKVSSALGKVEAYHKRELDEMNARITEMKEESNKSIEKLDRRLDTIQAQNMQIATDLATLTGYIKAQK
jgi:cob(I)alamin adenosyltransferase